MKYPITITADPVKQADHVASLIAASQPDSDAIISHDEMLKQAGVQPPTDGDRHVWRKHSLWLLRFRTRLVAQVLETTGRLLVSVYGEGYRLLTPGEVALHAEDECHESVQRAIRKLTNIVESVRDKDLTMEERNEKRAVLARAGRLAQSHRAYLDTVNHERVALAAARADAFN